MSFESAINKLREVCISIAEETDEEAKREKLLWLIQGCQAMPPVKVARINPDINWDDELKNLKG